MQFKGVNNKERQQYPRSEVGFGSACAIVWRRSGSAWSSFSQRGREQSSFSSPPSLPFFVFPLIFQCDWCLFFFFFLSLVRGGSWLGCSVVPAMGALFSLGAGCQKWKPLDTPGTQPPLSDAVVKLALALSNFF